MFRKSWFWLVCALIVLFVLVGCGSAPATTPTKPAATATALVVTVVITVTPPPATATVPPTLTPIPTVAAPGSPTAAPKATTVPGTPKATATKKPTTAAVVPTNTAVPVPIKYPPVTLLGPIFDPNGRKDQVVVGNEIVYQWGSVGGLGANECYLLRADFNPGAGDNFILCDPSYTQVAQSQIVKFIMVRPGYTGVSYSGLLAQDASSTTVSWYVMIVRDDGVGTPGAYAPDGSRHKFTPLSPKSNTAQFPLFGGK